MATYKFTIHKDSSRKDLIKNLTGQKFGRLLVLGYAGSSSKNKGAMWHCLCNCGNGSTYIGSRLISGNTRSCGCLRHDVISQLKQNARTRMPEYRAYHNAKKRCDNPFDPEYHNYGGRGIKFRFKSYDDFFNEIGNRPTPHHSLDRIDNEGHYEKGNVRWTTYIIQLRNRRSNQLITAFGRTQCIAAWAEESHLSWKSIKHRITTLQWCAECSVSLPNFHRCLHKSNSIANG